MFQNQILEPIGFLSFEVLKRTAMRLHYGCGFATLSRDEQQRTYFKRTIVIWLSVLAFVLMVSVPVAQATEPASGVYVYSVRHSLFGNIGKYQVRLARDGADVIVNVDAYATVKLMFFTLLRLHTSGREVWRDGRLVAFDGRSVENGKTVLVSARAGTEGVVIFGPDGRRETVEPIALTNPWHSAALEAPILLEPTSGGLLNVHARFANAETINQDGQMTAARKHIISGDIEAKIWFSENGTWLQMEFDRAGGRVKIVLESSTLSEAPLNYALSPPQ
jgi:hypothetical protein